MIFEGSRYDREPVVRAPTAEGVSYPTIYPRFVPNPLFLASTYRTVTGDRLDVLAGQAYGNSELWWVLARANPDVFYPEDIAPGTLILVPSLDDFLPGSVF
jgi:nucleoid-associated protein YgaU